MAYFLGIDAGTQSMKGLLIDPAKSWCSEPFSVHFGRELGSYNSPDGFLPDDDPAIRHADPCMWLDALDMLLAKMRDAGLPMAQVEGISGSAQQHGTVYLNQRAGHILAALSPTRNLAEQLRPALSRPSAPIWMDASTGAECRELRRQYGEELRRITGSNAAERFSGPQIMKFARQEPERYRETASIALVSSFLASVLAGKIMPMDRGDAAGMNLLDLRTLRWHEGIVEFTAPGLREKLPPCVPSDTVGGILSAYFARYGLRPGIPINVFSGDNPCSLIGCGGAAPGTAIISLGTSDTFFGSVADLSRTERMRFGHIFGNPAGGFMTLLCFANGSLTREAVRKKFAMSRFAFEAAAAAATPGKYPLLPFLFPESTPAVAEPGIRCDFDPAALPSGEFIRAVLEAQLLTIKYHAGITEAPASVQLTGGASASPILRRLAADIFQSPVVIGGHAEAAALGAAMRGANSCGSWQFDRLTEKFCTATEVIRPDRSMRPIYDRALAEFTVLLHRHGF